MAAEVLEPIYVGAAALARPGPRLRGEARQRERPARAAAAHPVRRAALRGAARGLREREPVVRAAVPRGARATRRSAISSSGSASIVDNWAFVAQTYQQYLDDEAGESDELRDVAIAAAAIYDRRLDDVDRAYAAYRRALAIQVEDAVPNERELIRRLEELLGAQPEVGRAGHDLRGRDRARRRRSAPRGAGQARAPARGRPRRPGPRDRRLARGRASRTEGGGTPMARARLPRGGRRARAAVPRSASSGPSSSICSRRA